jgi:hypothetical protein
MATRHPIETAPRDFFIMLHGGGWITPEKDVVFGDAVAIWQSWGWVPRDVPAPDGYQNPAQWSPICPRGEAFSEELSA